MYNEKNLSEDLRMSKEIDARLKERRKARQARPSPKTVAKKVMETKNG